MVEADHGPRPGARSEGERVVLARSLGRRVEPALEGRLRVVGGGRAHLALLGDAGPVWLDLREDAIGPRCVEVERLPAWSVGTEVERDRTRLRSVSLDVQRIEAPALDEVELRTATSRAAGAFDPRWPSPSERARRAAALFEAWAAEAPGWGLVEGALGEAVGALAGSLPSGAPSPERVLEALVGLGPGLTPSGDDLAGGYLWASRVRTGALGDDASVRLAEAAGARTTPFGAARLVDHARGEGCPAERSLVEALFALRFDPGRIDASLDALDRLGHSSGWDFALGLGLGLAPWGAPTALALRASRIERDRRTGGSER